MATVRKSLFAFMAWALPLAMVLSWAGGAAAMVCQAEGALVRGGCCCTPGMSDAQMVGAQRGEQTSIQDAECCETQVAQAPVVVPADLSLSPQLWPPLQVLCLQLGVHVKPFLPVRGWASSPELHATGRPIVLLKQSFLI